jgi:hypothetical protein
VDVGRALQQLVGDDEPGDAQDRRDGEPDRDSPVLAPKPLRMEQQAGGIAKSACGGWLVDGGGCYGGGSADALPATPPGGK